MPKRKMTPARLRQIHDWQRAGANSRKGKVAIKIPRKLRSTAVYSGKSEALSVHRAVMKTRNTYKRPSSNPAFGTKVVAAQKFLKHHGSKAENARLTKPTRGVVVKSALGSRKVYPGKKRYGPGRGH